MTREPSSGATMDHACQSAPSNPNTCTSNPSYTPDSSSKSWLNTPRELDMCQLSKLFNPKSHDAFYGLGGLAGLEKGLRTNRDSGLSVDETNVDGTVAFEDVAPKVCPRYGANGSVEPVAKEDSLAALSPSTIFVTNSAFADRKRAFMDNRLPEKKSKTLLELAWIIYNDKILILLTGAALLSLALGLYQTFGVQHEDGGAKVEWVEGVAIIAAILTVIVVGTPNDWQMETQFNKLSQKYNERTVKVVRSGKSVEISVFDIMVGDVMLLDTGELVPADGIFISGHGVKCDESSATGESDLQKKVAADEVFAALQEAANGGTQLKNVEKLDPFIISGSKVNEGTGKFLVTAVGVNSSYGRITMAIEKGQEDTPLQKKLNNLADWIAKLGSGAALFLFIVLLIKFCSALPNNPETPTQKGQTFLRLFVTSVTVVVVAIPEGLPLAVTLALAFATTRMMRDSNLVRDLKACETMGNATTVCSDETGTLTQNKMTVVAATLGKSISFDGTDTPSKEPREKPKVPTTIPNVPGTEFAKGLGSSIKQLLVQSNAVNSTAFEGDDKFIGSKTEIALLTFCRDDFGAAPVQEERSNANVVQVVPFHSDVKYMATVVKLPNGMYRAYVKGASEILLANCDKQDREILSETITSYAGQTLRTICTSYRDFESWPPRELEGAKDLTAEEFNKIHKNMTLVAIFGIKDPLRPTVKDAIKDCHRAGVFVRMITGDNIL
ncbi:E1-E2 ATPase-domain-containing protein [Podospora didyma]|uniref:E1-E2 ATPase-domain-containing protein n=1 Tax=Podospora didyma TaxID=330526 RepID=A0AAE0JY81_9PEZI|nr:E1-E2 ATPase-domain-containing protein [Podospora didyma]